MRIAAVTAAILLMAAPVAAEPSQGRTLEELKTEIQARADRNAYPLIGLKADEVREALSHITSLERDDWAAAWGAIGDRYMAQARAASAPADADKAYLAAWHYYSFARWPVPNSPGKQQAYEHALEAWRAHARLMDPAPETVRLPFEGKEIVGYVQMPKNASKPAPFVIAISGLDSRKEEMIERFRPLLAHGVGSLALDSPGTGEAPVKVAPGAERTLIAAIDAVLQRPDIDKGRVALYGGSYGAYWATLLAVSERTRLRAVVAQSPPVHQATTTLEQLADARERQSLKALGVLDQPTAPMLVIAGVRDTQVEMADIDLLLHSGPTPKEAWIHPAGGHMGRDAKDWPDPVIFRKVTMPWLLRALEVKVE
jgi:dienelactone hydrolase